jgi:hypothetical protein
MTRAVRSVGFGWPDYRRKGVAAVLGAFAPRRRPVALSFTVSQALLVRDLPIRSQDDVVVLWGETPDRSFTNFPYTYDQARDFRARARSLESAAFFSYYGAWPAAILEGDEITRLRQAEAGPRGPGREGEEGSR